MTNSNMRLIGDEGKFMNIQNTEQSERVLRLQII